MTKKLSFFAIFHKWKKGHVIMYGGQVFVKTQRIWETYFLRENQLPLQCSPRLMRQADPWGVKVERVEV